MKHSRLFVPALIVASCAVLSRAGAADAPSIDTIVEKYITAIGGKAALEKVTSRVMKFKMESEMFPASEGEISTRAPNKQRSQTEVGGAGTVMEGFDGTVAWSKNPWEGLRVKTGDELAKVKRDTEFHRELKLKTLYPDLAYKGTEKVGDEEVYVLESKPSATSKERISFSTKTGLLVRQESVFEGAQGTVNVQMLAKEYKAFDGLKHPTEMKIKVSAGGQNFEMTMKVTEIKQNVAIEDAKFAKPAA
jgi:zinc protease